MYQLSSTSSLRVIQPESWSNETQYQKEIHLTEFLDKESRFYDGYFQYKYAIFQASPDFFAHKLSHILAYSFLTIFIYYSFKKRNRMFQTWFMISFIALLDEINQYFIIGRTGLLIDVVLDSISSMITLMMILFISVHLRIKRKREKHMISM